jgi:hypothetical protein
MDGALNLNDCGDIGLPFRANDRVWRNKHDNGSGFVAIASFPIHDLNGTERYGGGASGVDRLAQARLVVLELNDQMGVRCSRTFEGCFLQCLALHCIERVDMAGHIELLQQLLYGGDFVGLRVDFDMRRTSAVSTANALSTRFALASLKLSKLPLTIEARWNRPR